MQADDSYDFPISPLAHIGVEERIERVEVTEVIDPNDIQVARILNPFNPREFVRDTLKWEPGNTLRDYIPHGSAASAVSVNGKIIPLEDFGTTYLERGDHLVICPIPQGGGGGGDKQILGMVAMIAITIMAPYMAPALAGVMGTTAAIAQGMIVMAGSLLVNAVMAATTKTDNPKESRSYGIDGPKNTSVEGLPVPVPYGQFRYGGNVVQTHTESDGDQQYLYMLINCGEGPVGSITGVRINDQPVENYVHEDASGKKTPLVEVQTRLGGNVQPPINWFDNQIVPQNKNIQLTTTWTTHTTTTAVEKLRFDFVAPAGIYYNDVDDGEIEAEHVDIKLQYRKQGDTLWKSMRFQSVMIGMRDVYKDSVSVDLSQYKTDTEGNYYQLQGGSWVPVVPATVQWRYSDDNSSVSQEDLDYIQENAYIPMGESANQISNPSTFKVPLYGDSVYRMEGDSKSAVRRSVITEKLEQAVYEVRVARLVEEVKDDPNHVESVFLSDINEIQLEPLSYPNTALLGLKVKLGDQITGLPSVSHLNGGKMISVWGRPVTDALQDQWFQKSSSNPAWVVWDILTNKRYGGGISTTRMDFSAFKRWAAHCDDEGLEFNAVIDNEMNVWDAAQLALRCGHAQLVNVGTRYTVVVERAATPVMMFSVANMVKDSYKETWLGMADRANEIDVTFYDRTDDHKQRTVKVYDPSVITSGRKQRSSAVTLLGVTDVNRAYKEAQLMLNLNRFIQKTVSFSAPLEAIACTVGDLIYVQHDMPDWAQAGRFEAGSTANILKLDRTITMEANKTYRVLVLQDRVLRSSGTVQNVIGNTIIVNGATGSSPVKRFQVASTGKDTGILDVTPNSVTVDDPTGILVGQAYGLYDTDVVEEKGVVLAAGDTDTITLTGALFSAPAQFAHWMFGEVDRVKQPFRIKSISSNSDYHCDITALQYSEAVYNYSRFPSGTAPETDNSKAAITNVQNLDVYEETRIVNSTIQTEVRATWSTPSSGLYAGADIWVKRDGGAWAQLGSVPNRLSVTIPASRGELISVKVIAYDQAGNRAPADGAPVVTYKVVGELPALNVGAVSGADIIWAGKDCRLTWRYNSTTHSYEFGSEPVGADAGALDPHFKDYEIKVFDLDDAPNAAPRRVDYTTDNSYTYSYEKNHTDGLTRKLKFEVRMRDIFNNVGQPATLTAENSLPIVTGLTAQPNFEAVNLAWAVSADIDFAGVRVWLSDNEEEIEGNIERAGYNDNLVYDGPDAATLISGLLFDHDYYVRAAAYDVFGKSGLTATAVIHFKTTHLDIQAIAEGVIGESLLLPTLQDRINLVDAPSTTAGSVAARILAEAQARASAITSEAADRAAAIAAEATARANAIAATQALITAEATARANALLAEAAARGTAITSETVQRQSADDALALQVSLVTAGVAGGFDYGKVWYFDSGAEGWTSAGAAQSTPTPGWVDIDSSGTDPQFISPAVSFLGGTYPVIKARVKRLAGTESSWHGAAYYTTSGHGFSESFKKTISVPVPFDVGDSAIVEFQMDALTAGGSDWINNTITGIRLDFGAASDDTISVDWVAIGRNAPGASVAGLLTEQQARIDGDAAEAAQRTTLAARVTTAEAGILAEQGARASGDTANANSISALTVTVNTNATNASAALTTEQNARVAGDTANANAISTLTTTVNGNTAAIASEAATRSNADTALANTISTLTTTVNGNTAAITAEQTARSNADSSLASSISTLSTTVNNNQTAAQAAVTAEQTARISGDTANANAISTLTTTVNGHASAITSEQTARANADTALAQQVTAVGTSFRATQLGLPLDQWTLNGQSIIQVANGKVGNMVLRINSNEGSYPNQGTYVAIDRTKKYRVRFWARPGHQSTDGVLYFNLRQFITPGSAGPDNGGRSPYKPGAVSRAAHNAIFGTDAWGEYSHIWDAADWQTGVQFVQPEFLNNYNGVFGFWEIQDFHFEEVTDLLLTNAAIVTEQTARTTADTALAQQITTLSAQTTADIAAAVQTEQTARTGVDSALATSISSLATTVDGNSAAITAEQTARANADSALSASINTVAAQAGANAAAITAEQTARADADSSLASQITSLSTTVGNTNAALATEASTRASSDTALSNLINTVSTTVDGNTASIQTHQSSLDGLLLQYVVKLDNNGYVSGFGLASSGSGTPTSEFVIRADKFVMTMPGYPGYYPFTIGTVNGVPRVIIDSALIGDATIGSAKIGHLTVGSHNIALGATSATGFVNGSSTCSYTLYVPPEGATSVIIWVDPGISSVGDGGEGGGSDIMDQATLTYTSDMGGSGTLVNLHRGMFMYAFQPTGNVTYQFTATAARSGSAMRNVFMTVLLAKR